MTESIGSMAALVGAGYLGERYLWGLAGGTPGNPGGSSPTDLGTRTPGHEVQRLWHTHWRQWLGSELELGAVPASGVAGYRVWLARHVERYGAQPGTGATAGGAVPRWSREVARAAARVWASIGRQALADMAMPWGADTTNGPGDVESLGSDIARRVGSLERLASSLLAALGDDEAADVARQVREAVYSLVLSIDGAGAGSYGWRELDTYLDFASERAQEVAADVADAAGSVAGAAAALAWRIARGALSGLVTPLGGAAALAALVYVAHRRGVL